MWVSEEVKKQYFDALINQQFGSSESMKAFKRAYPDVYAMINSMYHKRVKVRKDIECMRHYSNNKVYFGSLTFEEGKDQNKITSKRQECFRFLNTIFEMFLLVEELGESNSRYHVHYVGVFREGKTFEDLFKWHSREDIQIVKSTRSVAKYLCNYIVKQVPRIRRNKMLVKVSKRYAKAQYFNSIHWECLGVKYEQLGLMDLIVGE